MKTVIQIVAFNAVQVLEQTLNSLEWVKDVKDVSIKLLDNASQQDIKTLASKYDYVEYIKSDTNLGFGRGHNFIFRSIDVKPDFVLLLNPDCQIEKASFDVLVDFSKDNHCAITAPKLIDTQGDIEESIRGKLNLFNFISRGLFDLVYKKKTKAPNKPKVVNAVSGACMLLDTSYFSKEIFDPNFFLYYEDNDLCEVLNKIGGKIWYLPNSVAVHQKSSSMKESLTNPELRRIVENSLIYYFNKHRPTWEYHLMKFYIRLLNIWRKLF